MEKNPTATATEELPEELSENIGNAETSGKAKQKKKKKFPKWLIFVIIIVLIIAAFGVMKIVGKKKTGKTEQPTAVAAIGNVVKVIEGEGTVEVDQYEATSLVKGEIIGCYIEEGDYVEKDQVLYEIDSGDMENSIKRAENALKTAQNNYNEILKNIEDLNVTAPIGGVISELNVKNGDTVGNGSVIAKIIDSSVMKLKITFLKTDAANMYVGQNAAVTLTKAGERVSGTVSSISTGSLVNADGVAVSTVEIKVNNPGAIVPGDKATAVAGSFACCDMGVFEYNNSETVTAKQSGKIRNLNVDTADKVSNGSILATIENTNLTNQVDSARIQLENAQLSLDDLYDTLDNYKIKSSISGKVIQKNSKLGDKIDNMNAQTVMAIVSDPSELSFEMNVDELDISLLKAGQQAIVTADALDGQIFKAHVDNVSEVASAQNGVTTYPVKIVIDAEENSGLISGMNVDAVITIDSRENVLTVPASAVQRGNIVFVKKDGTSAKENKEDKEKTEEKGNAKGGNRGGMSAFVPEGFEAVKVEVGIADENNVEILSGLKEGDVVAVQEENTASDVMRAMMGGMMGGGHPGGGQGAPGGGQGSRGGR